MRKNLILSHQQADNLLMKYKFTDILKSQRGAGIVEYILMLIIAVAIGQAAYQMSDSFRAWAQNYYVAYYQCLLETGELPALGNQETQGICAQEYEPFTFEAGRPPNQNANNSGDGATAEGVGNSAANTGRSIGGSSEVDSNLISVGGGGIGGRGPSRFSAGRSGSGDGDGGIKDRGKEKKNYTGDTGGVDAQKIREARIPVGKNSKVLGGVGYIDDEEDRGREKAKVGKKEKKDAGGDRQRKIKVNRKVAKAEVIEDEGYSFGDYIRFLIIAGIIIAIIMLLLGQFAQLSKGAE